eukprot:208497-Pleurochrysis_carterae.AAC.1
MTPAMTSEAAAPKQRARAMFAPNERGLCTLLESMTQVRKRRAASKLAHEVDEVQKPRMQPPRLQKPTLAPRETFFLNPSRTQ